MSLRFDRRGDLLRARADLRGRPTLRPFRLRVGVNPPRPEPELRIMSGSRRRRIVELFLLRGGTDRRWGWAGSDATLTVSEVR